MDSVIMMVHGGAAVIAKERIGGKMKGVQNAAKIGHDILVNKGSALDAVEAAIRSMESDEYFNAGFGSILNHEGRVEMDASIMEGDLTAGSAAIIRDVEHPISLARLVKEQSPHVLIAGTGVSSFAKERGMPIINPDSLVSEYSKKCLKSFLEQGLSSETRELGGTVGAVALDVNGNVAAGTSTGGTNGKLNGRIGDTPIIGAGTYADNRSGAVSCTGHGEAILRCSLAHSIVSEMHSGKTPTDSVQDCIQYVKERTGSTVGAISVSKSGDVGLHFSTSMMPWTYIKNGEMHYGLLPGENKTQPLTAQYQN